MRYDAKRAGVASVWEREKQVRSSSEAITSSRLVSGGSKLVNWRRRNWPGCAASSGPAM